MKERRVVESLTSRLCHDLASPITALSLNFESLEDSLPQEIKLPLQAPLRKLSSLLFFYRSFCSAPDTSLSLEQVFSWAKNHFPQHQYVFEDFILENGKEVLSKIILGVLFLTGNALYASGEIHLSNQKNGSFIITAKAPKIFFKSSLIEVLSAKESSSSISSETIVAHFLKEMAFSLSHFFVYDAVKENKFSLRFLPYVFPSLSE